MFLTQLIMFLVLGLIVGSFLNVLVFRMDDIHSVLVGRSHCPNCKEKLKPIDLIPLLSFLLLKGKCRYCKKPISFQYPLVEGITAIVFAFLYFCFGAGIELAFYALVFSGLIVIATYDIKTQLIPEEFAWGTLILTLIGSWYINDLGVGSMLLGALVGGGTLAALSYGSKEKWMGKGDVKIGLIMGALVGFPVSILGLFVSFLSGSIIGLIYIKLANKTLKDALPFAPFIVFSALFCLIYGGNIVHWYLYVFGMSY